MNRSRRESNSRRTSAGGGGGLANSSRRESGRHRRDSTSSRRESGRHTGSRRFSNRLFGRPSLSNNNNNNNEEAKQNFEEEQEDSNVSISSSSEGEEEADDMNTARNKRQSRMLSASMVKMTKSGSRAIKWSKILVFAVIFGLATFIIVMTYIFLKQEAQEDFEFEFRHISLEFLARANRKMATMESAFRTVSGMITAYTASSQSASQLWPLVTIPNWQLRAISTQEMSRALVLGMSPLVPTQNITQWQDYSLEHYQEWMEDALHHQEKMVQQLRKLSSVTTRDLHPQQQQQQQQQQSSSQMPVIWQEEPSEVTYIPELVYHHALEGYRIPAQVPASSSSSSSSSSSLSLSSQYVVPIWQLAPAPRHNATIINYDLLNLTVVANSVERLLQTQQPVLTPAFPQIEWWWNGAVADLDNRDMHAPEEQQQPCSLLLQPVFDKQKANRNDNTAAGEPQLTGIAHAVIPWNVYMEQNLADSSLRGVHVVLEWFSSECSSLDDTNTPIPSDRDIHPTFTYRIDGKHATFLGYGDLHETTYEDMMESMDFIVPTGNRRANEENCYNYGYYEWRVYPTEELRETNFTPSNTTAWLYATGVVAIFCVAGGIFLSYDYLVQLRQQAVVDTAIRSNAIISSLFPSNVRDRLMKDAEEQAKQEAKQRKLERKLERKRMKTEKKKKKAALVAAANNRQAPVDETDTFGVAKDQLRDFLSEGTGNAPAGNSEDLGYGEAKPSQAVPEPPAAFGGKPIADLFPNATVLFADIVGFTAWSSVREPTEVFQLLETVYHHFDEIAARRKVFKVETIGDCYVAVTGLPEPRRDHCLVMCRFAKSIMNKMKEICPKLEVILGPDTGDLQLRIGIHSGPVTAGVLRGEKSRFQLFGDTVNTAARMESTGAPSKMHISKETAELLKAAGKKWAKKREDKVHAKGKGELETYWLAPGKTESHSSQSESSSIGETATEGDLGDLIGFESNHGKTMPRLTSLNGMSNTLMNGNESRRSTYLRQSVNIGMEQSLKGFSKVIREYAKKNERLVQWNAEVLYRLLKQIKARRDAIKDNTKNAANNASAKTLISESNGTLGSTVNDCSDEDNADDDRFRGVANEVTALDEVKDVIYLPTFDPRLAKIQQDVKNLEIDKKVKEQCQAFVREVAALYSPNPFHNFEHASHVTMSVVKFMSRIVESDLAVGSVSDQNLTEAEARHKQLLQSLRDKTYGITSDPLTEFALVFSALIHDLDHPGVPNSTLVKEGVSLSALYKHRSIAERNSLDLAWTVLMESRFEDLRSAIFSTREEKQRFRQLVVNTVMATDIVDEELNKLRNTRWERAFEEKPTENENELRDDVNQKATVVLEHLIQASDVAHTMQHWHIYRKWNERAFEECYQAYLEGRAEEDPAESWFETELQMFDCYIIPLAKKLKECGVFGVGSDEYLNYAETNKAQWESDGMEVVQTIVEKFKNPTADIEEDDETDQE